MVSRKVKIITIGTAFVVVGLGAGLGIYFGIVVPNKRFQNPLSPANNPQLGNNPQNGNGGYQTPLTNPSSGSAHSGDLTYYAPGLGACGITSSSTENVCAISHIVYDASSNSANPNMNPLCGKRIRAWTGGSRTGAGGKSVTVTVVDRCEACAANDIDVSPKVFRELVSGGLGEGRVPVQWVWEG